NLKRQSLKLLKSEFASEFETSEFKIIKSQSSRRSLKLLKSEFASEFETSEFKMSEFEL
ncbi:hypothetical protein C1645_816341, partial [Glomus cerebriforme]